MEAIHGKTKKWGNSLAVIIPSKAVEQLELRENQELELFVLPRKKLTQSLFGKLAFKKSTQELKDEARKDLW